LSKVKIIDSNSANIEKANSIIDKILSMQASADMQVKNIRAVEKKILDIQKAKEIEVARIKEQEEKERAEKALAAKKAEEEAIRIQKEKERAEIKAREEAAAKKAEEEAAAKKAQEEAAAKKESKPAPKVDSEEKQNVPVKTNNADTRENKFDSRKQKNNRNDQRTNDEPVSDFPTKQKSGNDNKKHRKNNNNEDKPRTQKRGIKERVIMSDEEFPRGSRKRNKKQAPVQKPVIEPIKIEKAVITGDTVSVKLFAEKTGKPVSEILKKLLLLGMMCTINSQIDFDTASLVAAEFDIELEQKIEQTAEDVLVSGDESEDNEADIITRPPIVTIMGHVDHGKTSLLDKIRRSKITDTEAGGITQHIGAYQISVNGQPITFIDTPGHEAFTAMRLRGALVTDIAVLVVAADDGVMPQTIEAINHAKAAGVEIIVAINKIDKPSANPDRVKQELIEFGLLAEDWGGSTICCPVSAMSKEGIDNLLEMIILSAEMKELKANPKRQAKGTVIEAQLDKGRGPVATVLVQNGTLSIGDPIVIGSSYGRIRAMMDDKGRRVKKAGPSKPVEILGLSEVPVAGDTFYVADNEKQARQLAESVIAKNRVEMLKNTPQKVSLDDLFTQIQAGNVKDLNIVVKADVQGSVEAVRQSLEKLSNDEVRVRIIHGGVGAVTESDVMLASASNAIIIGFNVRPEPAAKAMADEEKVDVRLYRVIYNAIEDITAAMKGMLDPVYQEKVIGHAEVRQTFKASGVGTIAGSYVTDGKFQRNAKVRIVRDGIVIYEGELESLRRFKDDVKEVNTGYECGLVFKKFNDVKEGDNVEAFIMEEIPR